MEKRNKNIEDYMKAGQEIFNELHLATYPVSIKYIKEKTEIPKSASQPSKNTKMMSICQAFMNIKRNTV